MVAVTLAAVVPDSSLCVSRGCHIAGVCGASGSGIGLFAGVRDVAGVVVAAMCERWLSYRGGRAAAGCYA